MSNRTETDVSFAAELKAAHLAQIAALTDPGLTREERLERFMEAARFPPEECEHCRRNARQIRSWSVARIVWAYGSAPWSLFGDMPGCQCPVIEVARGAKIAGIPAHIPTDWTPTVSDLLPFARIQQERRIKGGNRP